MAGKIHGGEIKRTTKTKRWRERGRSGKKDGGNDQVNEKRKWLRLVAVVADVYFHSCFTCREFQPGITRSVGQATLAFCFLAGGTVRLRTLICGIVSRKKNGHRSIPVSRRTDEGKLHV